MAVLSAQHIVGLDIAMDDPGLMRHSECMREVTQHGAHLVLAVRPGRLPPHAQGELVGQTAARIVRQHEYEYVCGTVCRRHAEHAQQLEQMRRRRQSAHHLGLAQCSLGGAGGAAAGTGHAQHLEHHTLRAGTAATGSGPQQGARELQCSTAGAGQSVEHVVVGDLRTARGRQREEGQQRSVLTHVVGLSAQCGGDKGGEEAGILARLAAAAAAAARARLWLCSRGWQPARQAGGPALCHLEASAH